MEKQSYRDSEDDRIEIPKEIENMTLEEIEKELKEEYGHKVTND